GMSPKQNRIALCAFVGTQQNMRRTVTVVERYRANMYFNGFCLKMLCFAGHFLFFDDLSPLANQHIKILRGENNAEEKTQKMVCGNSCLRGFGVQHVVFHGGIGSGRGSAERRRGLHRHC
ncbi:MAG: hypothetical protein KIG24_02775, partial [Oscillospiraceae bacterium]|nr:hypothetical protein [Oscillospiraceae bacterium]